MRSGIGCSMLRNRLQHAETTLAGQGDADPVGSQCLYPMVLADSTALDDADGCAAADSTAPTGVDGPALDLSSLRDEHRQARLALKRQRRLERSYVRDGCSSDVGDPQ